MDVTGSSCPVTSVAIRPPSTGRESLHVLRFAALVLIVTWVAVAGGGRSDGSRSASTGLLPYQVPMANLSAVDQRTLRLLQEGALEAERARSADGRWPDVSSLAGNGIPPFSTDPITARAGYVWSRRISGSVIDYVGLSSAPAPSAFLLRFQEPAPGDPADRAPLDETHHRLANGTMLHVSIWVHGRASPASIVVSNVPPDAGWSQVISGPILDSRP